MQNSFCHFEVKKFKLMATGQDHKAYTGPVDGNYCIQQEGHFTGTCLSVSLSVSRTKVKVMSICIAPIHETALRRSGMHALSRDITVFTCTPCISSTSEMSHTCLCLPSRSWYSKIVDEFWWNLLEGCSVRLAKRLHWGQGYSCLECLSWWITFLALWPNVILFNCAKLYFVFVVLHTCL